MAPEYARHRCALDFVVDVLARLRAPSPRRPFLEVGCGTGAYTMAMAARTACPGFGMDAARGMLKSAPAHGPVAYVQGLAARLPFADQCLGMIFSVNVIHHMAKVEDYFRASFRALARGGILCTATDSEAMIRRRNPLSRYWPSTVAPELARYHGIDTLEDLMARAGFRSIRVCKGRSNFSISDIGPYRDRVFSCLRLIPEADFAHGLRAMEADLHTGPLMGTSELAFVHGARPE